MSGRRALPRARGRVRRLAEPHAPHDTLCGMAVVERAEALAEHGPRTPRVLAEDRAGAEGADDLRVRPGDDARRLVEDVEVRPTDGAVGLPVGRVDDDRAVQDRV